MKTETQIRRRKENWEMMQHRGMHKLHQQSIDELEWVLED